MVPRPLGEFPDDDGPAIKLKSEKIRAVLICEIKGLFQILYTRFYRSHMVQFDFHMLRFAEHIVFINNP